MSFSAVASPSHEEFVGEQGLTYQGKKVTQVNSEKNQMKFNTKLNFYLISFELDGGLKNHCHYHTTVVTSVITVNDGKRNSS